MGAKPRSLRIIDRPRLKVQFQLEARDFWVGLFWRVNRHPGYAIVHLYICLIPCVPLHISLLKETP